MNVGGWTCPHEREGVCDLIKKACDPGDKGCVLYGKFVFADPDSPSNRAVERREKTKSLKALRKELGLE